MRATAVNAAPGWAQADEIAQEAAAALATLQLVSETGDAATSRAYEEQLNGLADSVAERLLIQPERLRLAWDRADATHQAALLAALSQLGVPYRSRTSKPGVGFDCSGLTTYAWGVAGIGLARSSGDQIRSATAREPATAQAGDLVYYPGHVMMWLGVDAAIVHSPNSGNVVEVTYLSPRRAGSVRYGDPA